VTSLLADLRISLAFGPSALLIRHASRPVGQAPTASTPLTLEGQAAATQLGAAIGGSLRSGDRVIVAHSPVLRCAQTSSALRDGIGQSVATCRLVGERAYLGRPYLRNPSRALEVARRLGPDFVRQWFDGVMPSEWIQPLHTTATDQVRRALAEVHHKLEPRLAILVSHDWNLMAVREYFFGIRHEDAGWIDFLDGVIIRRAAGGVALSYRSTIVSTGGARTES